MINLIIKYNNSFKDMEITEVIEITKNDNLLQIKIRSLLKYYKLLCPYIFTDVFMEYYSLYPSYVDNIDYNLIYLRLEKAILDEIDFLNDYGNTKHLFFSIELYNDDREIDKDFINVCDELNGDSEFFLVKENI